MTIPFPSSPKFVMVVNSEGRHMAIVQANRATSGGTSMQWAIQGNQMQLTLESSVSVSWLKLRWPIEFNTHALFFGDEVERGYGHMGWSQMNPNRILPWYMMIDQHQETTGIGVQAQPNAFCFWQVDPDGITLNLDVRNGGDGVRLGDRHLELATIITATYSDISPFTATAKFCRLMNPNPVLPEKPVYGSNNWYYAYGKSSAEQIVRDSHYLGHLTSGISNRPWMVIDDGWQADHVVNGYNGGPWQNGNQSFPDMSQLAQKINDQGVRPGIWFRPLLDHRQTIPDSWRNPLTKALDPTIPEVLQQVKADVDQLCQWGYRLIKHDFSTFDLFGKWGFEMSPSITEDGWHFANQSLTNAEVVKQLYRTIYEAAGPSGTLILGCNTIGHLGAGLMQLARIGDDTSGKNWERTRQIGVNSLAFRLPQDRAFFSIDADCIGITHQIDWHFNYQWAKVVAESGTVMFISAAPGIMDAKQEQQLHQLMAIAANQQCHFQPLDWQEINCPAKWSDGNTTHYYDWYDPIGLSFAPNSRRGVPAYSIVK